MNKKSAKAIFKTGPVYQINGKLWIECEGEKFFGPGPMELLEKIDISGSINKAAMEMHMSYKKALEIINTLNTSLTAPLVITQSGGEKGGGSTITEDAKKLIEYHKQSRKRFAGFLKKETALLREMY